MRTGCIDGDGPEHEGLSDLAADKTVGRGASLRALHVLEYALSAPAPRRQRTWVHRVASAIEALQDAVNQEVLADAEPFGLLSEISLHEPKYALQIQRLRQERLDLAVAIASLREQIEPDPEFDCDPADIRDRLATITRRFRQHLARESDLVYDATSIDLQASPDR